MAEWDTSLRELLAEQMYLLRRSVGKVTVAWGQLSDGGERRAAYKDADRVIPFVIVREACLRTSVDAERGRARLLEQRVNDMALQIDLWRDRAIAAEAALADALARRPIPAAAAGDPGLIRPLAGPAEPPLVIAFPTAVARAQPSEPVLPDDAEGRPDPSRVEYDALISDALSTFRLLAAE